MRLQLFSNFMYFNRTKKNVWRIINGLTQIIRAKKILNLQRQMNIIMIHVNVKMTWSFNGQTNSDLELLWGRGRTVKKSSYNSYNESSEYLFLSVEMHRHRNGPFDVYSQREFYSEWKKKWLAKSLSQMAPNHTAFLYLFRCSVISLFIGEMKGKEMRSAT